MQYLPDFQFTDIKEGAVGFLSSLHPYTVAVYYMLQTLMIQWSLADLTSVGTVNTGQIITVVILKRLLQYNL